MKKQTKYNIQEKTSPYNCTQRRVNNRMYRYKQKKGKKKERSITSLNSLAPRNAQRSYKT